MSDKDFGVLPASPSVPTEHSAESNAPAHTPGPWTWCDCPSNCGHIGSKDDHLATVTFGGWGNSYPAIRPTNGTILGGQYEVYMETDYFGEVPLETAKANARLIAAAPDLLAALRGFTERSPKAEDWQAAYAAVRKATTASAVGTERSEVNQNNQVIP